jgi:choline monooxygenase
MTIADFTFETDLSAAATIPSVWYRDPDVLALEQDRIFARTWQLVGHSEQVALPGDYFTCTVADEPVVVTRADDGSIHAFSNVCRHRAGPVARDSGHRKALMCGYHGWTYGLDGKLLR